MPAALTTIVPGLLTGVLGSAAMLTDSPAGLATLAVIVAASLFFALMVMVRSDLVPGVSARHAAAVRRRAERTLFLPLCDPSASGRPRPRAPSAHYRVA